MPLSQTGAELLFEVFSQRYERGATLVTSNLPFDEWTSVFGSERLTGAFQRLIRLLRRKATETVFVTMATQVPIEAAMRPGPVDGASCDGHSAPPTDPLAEQVSTPGRGQRSAYAQSITLG